MLYTYLFFTFLMLVTPLKGPAQQYPEGFSQVQYDGTYFYAVADERYQIVKLNKQGKVIAGSIPFLNCWQR